MPPPPRGLLGPVFFSSRAAGFNGQKLCPLSHCGDTSVHSPQGLRDAPPPRGEAGAETKSQLCAGAPGASRAWPAVSGPNLSPVGRLGAERGSGRGARGPGVARRKVGEACQAPCLTAQQDGRHSRWNRCAAWPCAGNESLVRDVGWRRGATPAYL